MESWSNCWSNCWPNYAAEMLSKRNTKCIPKTTVYAHKCFEYSTIPQNWFTKTVLIIRKQHSRKPASQKKAVPLLLVLMRCVILDIAGLRLFIDLAQCPLTPLLRARFRRSRDNLLADALTERNLKKAASSGFENRKYVFILLRYVHWSY